MSATTDIRGELRAPIHPERRACTHPCFIPPLMAQSSRKGAGSGREKVSQWKVSGTLGRSRDLSEAVGRGHPSGGEGSRSAGRALPNPGQGQQSWWGLCGHQHKRMGRPPSRVCSWLTREAQTTEAIKTAKLSWETNSPQGQNQKLCDSGEVTAPSPCLSVICLPKTASFLLLPFLFATSQLEVRKKPKSQGPSS